MNTPPPPHPTPPHFLPKRVGVSNAVEKPKFMGRSPSRPPMVPGGGLPKSILGCPNYFDLSLKEIYFYFLVITTKFWCFLFKHGPTYPELSRSSDYFGGHVGSPDRVTDAFVDWATCYPQHWVRGPQGKFSSQPNIRGVNYNPNRSVKISQKWPKKSGYIWKFHKHYPKRVAQNEKVIPNRRNNFFPKID